MTSQLQLLDYATRDDLRVYLERLQRFGQAEVRLVVRGSVLAVFGCTQAPATLLDPLPAVLVLRSFALASGLVSELDGTDITVMGRGLLDRIARMGVLGLVLELPDAHVAAAWAGVLPPRGGWEASGVIDGGSLATVAREGIDRVAAALPDSPGDAIVRKVRESVWGAEIAPGLPAAAAFAAEAMGFLADETRVPLARSRTWTRLDTSRGQVLVRSVP